MRTVALISGGKDSCYNMMKCVAAGHEIVALANLRPTDKDELDSFMFQTVGHEGVELFAEAMGLPLYRANTKGISLSRELHYSHSEGDEVEDLFQLLRRVKDELGVEAVSSGAVLSDYQRLRVENVCCRLGLVSLAYLWQRDQADLLQEMIDAGVKAVLIKVASMGLVPEKHLGRTTKELYPELYKLNQQYGINVCGEGGEYETFTLDCPLFRKEIILEDSEIVYESMNAFAPVGYLKLRKLLLREKKEAQSSGVTSVEQWHLGKVPSEQDHEGDRVATPSSDHSCLVQLVSNDRHTQCVVKGGHMWLAWDGDRELVSIPDQTVQLFSELEVQLSRHGFRWSHVALVYLYLSRMADYPSVNGVYSRYFPSQPPARVCVAACLPDGVLVRVEAVVWRCEGGEGGEGVEEEEGRRRWTGKRSSLHVQSHSEWAPANIGPYSQAYTISQTVFAAGQIGLDPAQMVLVDPSDQPSLSLTHTRTVLKACHAHLNSALCGMCYFTTEEAAWRAREAWSQFLRVSGERIGCPVLFVRVSGGDGLPRGATVEWHFVAMATPHTPQYSVNYFMEEDVGMCLLVHEAWCQELSLGSWAITFATAPGLALSAIDQRDPPDIREVITKGLTRLKSQLNSHQLHFSDLTYLRLCVPKYGQIQKPLCAKDVVSMCADLGPSCNDRGSALKETALSLLTVEGYDGRNSCITLHACLALTPIICRN